MNGIPPKFTMAFIEYNKVMSVLLALMCCGSEGTLVTSTDQAAISLASDTTPKAGLKETIGSGMPKRIDRRQC